jgi:hypothetical protein
LICLVVLVGFTNAKETNVAQAKNKGIDFHMVVV